MSMNPTREDRGASAVEYALLVVAVAAIIVLAVFAIGGWTGGMFNKTCSEIADNAPASITSTAEADCP